MSDLTTRGITGTLFVVVMLVCLSFSIYSLLFAFFIINFLGIWEYQTLVLQYKVNAHASPKEEKLLLATIGSIFYVLVACTTTGLLPPRYLLLLLPLLFSLGIKELFAQAAQPFIKLALNLLGFFYISLPMALFAGVAMYGGEFTPERIVGIFLLGWANDAMAYAIGRKIGKTPLLPRVSPKKTWEGTIGGAISCLLVSQLIFLLLGEHNSGEWFLIALITTVMANLGDLIESLLKRSLKVKDSGNILPGHGGILDRFDAIIFAVPFIYTLLHFM